MSQKKSGNRFNGFFQIVRQNKTSKTVETVAEVKKRRMAPG